MIPNIYRYPLDLTGSNSSNYVTGENQLIGSAPYRAFAPQAGSFFGSSMEIMDLANYQNLTPEQFQFQFLHTDASIETGQEVWGVVVITDPSVSTQVSLTYQALGGQNAQPTTTIGQEIAALTLDDRNVKFANITDKPDVYTPVPHTHWVGDTYDWDYVVSALEMCLQATLISKAATYDSTLTYIDQQSGLRNVDISNFAAQLQAHIQNYQNPHQTTLTQVDAYSTAQADALVLAEANNRVAADAVVLGNIQAHASNTNNPHVDTANSIGAYNTTQSDANLAAVIASLQATLASDSLDMNEHIANTNNPHKVSLTQINGMTTAAIQSAVTTAMQPATTQMSTDHTALATHMANLSNPHGLTIAQIGAWDSGDIQAYQNATTAHIGNFSNPHGTTAAMVGTWTAVQSSNAIVNGFVTPVNNALTSQANAINAHTGNFSNPHGTTIYAIGGWQYGDWINSLNNARNVLSYH